MDKKMKSHINYVKNNSITYDTLTKMSDGDCVKVYSSYVYCLLAKYSHLEENDENVLNIFNKYLEIDDINYRLNKLNGVSRFFTISVKDMKIMMSSLDRNLKDTIKFFTSTIKASELDMIHDNLRNQLIKTQEQGHQLVKRYINS